MRHAILLVALFALMIFAAPAFALTIDRDSGMNTDGTAKFADPDDQMPGFMTPPGASSAPQATPGIALPMGPGDGSGMNFSVDRYGSGAPQSDAFDQAFDNK